VSIQFSANGPVFPSQLVDALLAGDVVFLCGAGVSAPQLPSFPRLVEKCFADLNVKMSSSEKKSFDDQRYEEVLGSLSRRIVEPTLMIKSIVKLLQPPAVLNLDNHRTILRLSRNMESQPTIVTTNFDTLIEKALRESVEVGSIRAHSFAGQDLPAPGSAGFDGIIHLHGRLADKDLNLEETTLVVTSAHYGDAYMRSGWASRFLFDLCRSKTIVLVGYSAGDAPFRYFLNVLEADRERFPDLRPVYALDAVNDRNENDVRWSTLAVEPLPYEYVLDPETGKESHSAMWQDLGKLADLAERPRYTRRALAQDILIKKYDTASQQELDQVKWLFAGQSDLWGIAINTILDPEWFGFLAKNKLWTNQDAARVVAGWIALDLQSADRFRLAVSWLKKVGSPFATEIDRRVLQAKDLPILWLRAWRLLAKSSPKVQDYDLQVYSTMGQLRGPLLLNMDIQDAVGFLTPVLTIGPNRGYFFREALPETPQRVSDLAWFSFSVPVRGGMSELIDAIVQAQQPTVSLSMASQNLQAFVRQAIDAEKIDDDHDSTSYWVPSVEAHDQNKHQDGPVFLIELIVRLIPTALKDDRDAVRSMAKIWSSLAGTLGQRLWLHTLREPDLFSSDEAMAGLEMLSLDAFWTIRREIPLLISDRSGDAKPDAIARIESRILSEASKYYERFEIEDEQVDWREHARDTTVWLRLKMLLQAEVISDAGRAELAAILERRNYLDRDVEDRDFFGSYSYDGKSVVGDAQPILEAPDEQRLEVAQKAVESQDIDKSEGWRAYCYADPRGAFDTLKDAQFNRANSLLWRDFVTSLSSSNKDLDVPTCELVILTLEILDTAPDAFLASIIHQLAGLYARAPRDDLPNHERWWVKLFTVSIAYDHEPLDGDRNLYDAAISSAGGRLTEAVLIDIQNCKEDGTDIPSWLINSIITVAKATGQQSTMARAVLIHNLGFLLNINGLEVNLPLTEALSGDGLEAIRLRSVLVSKRHISSKVSKAFSAQIILGLKELGGNRFDAIAAAENILLPAILIIRGESSSDDWGLSLADAADILRCGSPELREGAANVLAQWAETIEGGAVQAWRTVIGPLLDQIWPRERALRESGLTRYFTKLAVNSGDAFPEAFDQLRPYIMHLEQNGGEYQIESSKVPEDFPKQTLDLLWCLFGPGHTGSRTGVPELLKRLVRADSKIEFDRRLQWLDQNAEHYD
jgi:hypothetical protein